MIAPVLEGNGIRLEPMSRDHLAAMERIALEPSIWRYMMIRLQTVDDVRAWVDEAIERSAHGNIAVWVSRISGTGEIVGCSRLLDIDEKNRTAEIGFTWIAAPYRGAGVNPRVKLLQLGFCFESLRLRRVALKTHHENLQSQHAMLKLGAEYEGTFRNHLVMPDGSTRHTKWYSIVDEEWPAVKAGLEKRIATEPLQSRETS